MNEDERNWVKNLSPEDKSEWDAYVEHFRRSTLEKMTSSSAFLSLVPSGDTLDVQFCTELGAAIMLDKPILALLMPGAEPSEHLRRVADAIVTADIDTEEGRERTSEAIQSFMKEHHEQTG